MIRQAYWESPDYIPLVLRAYELWRKLERDTYTQLLHITGGMNIGSRDGDLVTRSIAAAEKHSIPFDVLDRRDNVLAFGNPGSGKTHLLCALGQELIARGRRMYFTTAALLVQDLLVAKRDLKLSRLIKKLGHFEGLIIDDLGYVQQSREEMEVLFTLLAERYERGSVFISSNLPFSKWEGIFKDPMTTAAAIDRLVHHCVILELNIPSYRVEQAKKAQTEAAAE